MDNVNPASFIGVRGPEFEVPIEEGKVAELARATGSGDIRAYRGRRATTPPTFLTVANYFWGYSLECPGDTAFANLGIDPTLLLHAEEEFVFFGPPPQAGDRLRARGTLVSAARKQGRKGGELTFYTVETEYRTPDGRLVAVQRTKAVQTENAVDV